MSWAATRARMLSSVVKRMVYVDSRTPFHLTARPTHTRTHTHTHTHTLSTPWTTTGLWLVGRGVCTHTHITKVLQAPTEPPTRSEEHKTRHSYSIPQHSHHSVLPTLTLQSPHQKWLCHPGTPEHVLHLGRSECATCCSSAEIDRCAVCVWGGHVVCVGGTCSVCVGDM